MYDPADIRKALKRSRKAISAPENRTKLVASGALAGLVAGAASSPFLRANLRYALSSAKAQKGLDAGSKIPPGVIAEAKQIASHLRKQGINPRKARIAVTGAGGTGKSTLARALGEELGMGHNNLDHATKVTRKGLKWNRDFSRTQFTRGTIHEQSHLLAEVSPDRFDAVIHLEAPANQVKNRLLKRKRGAFQGELWDYVKTQKVLREAADSAGGVRTDFSNGRAFVRTPERGRRGRFQSADEYLAGTREWFGSNKIKNRQDAIYSRVQGSPSRYRGLPSLVNPYAPAKGVGAAAAGAGGAYGAGATLEKKAMDDKTKRRLAIGAGIVGGAGLGAAAFHLKSPFVRAELRNLIKTRGKVRSADAGKALHPQAIADAKEIARHLRRQGIDPAKAKIAITGAGGTGKSTLAKALGESLYGKGYPLAHSPSNAVHVHGNASGKLHSQTRSIGKFRGGDASKYKPMAGSISEKTNLLTTSSPERYDVLVHLERPTADVKKMIKKRGKGATQIHWRDYDKLRNNLRDAFQYTRGSAHDINPVVKVKIKPRGGFASDRLLKEEMQHLGIEASDKMTRADKLISITTGKKTKYKGNLSYYRTKELSKGYGGASLAGGGAGGGGAYLASNATYGEKKAHYRSLASKYRVTK